METEFKEEGTYANITKLLNNHAFQTTAQKIVHDYTKETITIFIIDLKMHN